jgi:hypothetical protein
LIVTSHFFFISLTAQDDPLQERLRREVASRLVVVFLVEEYAVALATNRGADIARRVRFSDSNTNPF